VQDNLKHKQTVNRIIKKLQPTIQSFKYATKLLSTDTMKKLYDQHIFPHLIYAITIWGTEDEHKTYMQPLIRTQKKMIRILANTKPRAYTAAVQHTNTQQPV
jgi:hypothetical protein